MKQLIPTSKNTKGTIIVSGRDLHEFLELKAQYTNWFDRMCDYGFVENVDFTVFNKKVNDDTAFGGYRKITDHAMTLDMAKEISMIQRNEKGKQARQYFIEVEKEYRKQQQKPLSLDEQIQVIAKGYVNFEKKLDNIAEIVSLNTVDWRKTSQNLIHKMAQTQGGFGAYRDIQSDIYEATDVRAGSSLKTRLTNLQKNMALEGASKSKIKRTNRLDVIEQDKRLKEIYMAVVKDFAIKYKVWDQEY